jgi:hypothetical protein
MLKPGGELLYKLLGPANEAVLYNARRGEA